MAQQAVIVVLAITRDGARLLLDASTSAGLPRPSSSLGWSGEYFLTYQETSRGRVAAFSTSGRSIELHLEAQILDATGQAVGELGPIAPVEVVGPQIAVDAASAEHVIRRGEDRGGDRHDRLHGSAPALQPSVLRL